MTRNPFPSSFPSRRGAAEPFPGSDLTGRERDILAVIRDQGAITRSALIQASGLTGPAIFRATEDLSQKGYLKIGATIAAGRGQPSHEVRLNPDAAYTLGLSVMTDYAEAAIMDLGGEVRCSCNVSAPDMKRDAILHNAQRFLAAQFDNGLPPQRLAGVGLALAGYFVGEGELMNPASPLDDWALVDLRAPLEACFGVPAIIENIANAAAVGESLLGVGRSTRTFAYVNFAHGFGGGFIIDRQLWRGVTGNAGEFAAVLNTIGAFVPNLESLRLILAENGLQADNVEQLVHKVTLDMPGVREWIGEAAKSVRLLAMLIADTVDTSVVVLGGRLPKPLAARLAADAQIPQSEIDRTQRRVRGRPAPKIIAAELPVSGTAIGAAALPLAQFVFSSPG